MRGWGNPSAGERQAEGGSRRKAGRSLRAPARQVTPCLSPGASCSVRALLILGKHFPCQHQGREGELCKPWAPRGSAFPPAPNINTRLLACLSLLPLVSLLLSSFLPSLDRTRSLGCQGSSQGGSLWGERCKQRHKLHTMTPF